MCDLVRPYTQKNPWSALCEPSEKVKTKQATVVLGASHSTSCRGHGNTCRCHWNTRRFHGKTHRSLGNTLLRDSSHVLVRRVPSIHAQQTIEIVGSVCMFAESHRSNIYLMGCSHFGSNFDFCLAYIAKVLLVRVLPLSFDGLPTCTRTTYARRL